MFDIFGQIYKKHKFALISETVRDRAKQIKTCWKMFITEIESKIPSKYIYWLWFYLTPSANHFSNRGFHCLNNFNNNLKYKINIFVFFV